MANFEDLLDDKIDELENLIDKAETKLNDTKKGSQRFGESMFYKSFAEDYIELSKLQFALDILTDLKDENNLE